MCAGVDFNWVLARFNCSVVREFVELKRLVESDVATRNARKSTNDQVTFEVSGGSESFAVFRYRQGLSSNAYEPRSVEFAIKDQTICAKVGSRTIAGNLTLNKDGNCVFRVNGEELNSWQFRMSALEELFFD